MNTMKKYIIFFFIVLILNEVYSFNFKIDVSSDTILLIKNMVKQETKPILDELKLLSKKIDSLIAVINSIKYKQDYIGKRIKEINDKITVFLMFIGEDVYVIQRDRKGKIIFEGFVKNITMRPTLLDIYNRIYKKYIKKYRREK